MDTTEQEPRSNHARIKQIRRCIPDSAVDAAIMFGREIRQVKGRIVYFIGRKEVTEALVRGCDIASHKNTIVIQARDGTIVTVIKSSDAGRLKHLMK